MSRITTPEKGWTLCSKEGNVKICLHLAKTVKPAMCARVQLFISKLPYFPNQNESDHFNAIISSTAASLP